MVSDTFVDAEAFSTRGNGPQASETPPQDKLPETRTIKGPRLVRGVACYGDEGVQLGDVGSTLEGARRRSASVLGKPGCPGPSWCRVGQAERRVGAGEGRSRQGVQSGTCFHSNCRPSPAAGDLARHLGCALRPGSARPTCGPFQTTRRCPAGSSAGPPWCPGALAPGDTRKGTSPRD